MRFGWTSIPCGWWRIEPRRPRLAPEDVSFVGDVVPGQLDSFPRMKLPTSVRHPAGFAVSGASVGTFVRGALLVAGQKALGRRFGGSEFYERVRRTWRSASCARIFITAIRRAYIAASSARLR